MSETHRNLNGIQNANQKALWERPMNPSVKTSKSADQDTKAQTKDSKSLPVSKSLNK